MSLIKDEDEKRKDYIFKKDKITKNGAKIIVIVLVVCIIAVIVSGIIL